MFWLPVNGDSKHEKQMAQLEPAWEKWVGQTKTK